MHVTKRHLFIAGMTLLVLALCVVCIGVVTVVYEFLMADWQDWP